MGKNKMIAKSCPKCELQVAVASKTCKCGHSFFSARRGADSLPVVEDVRRRTGRVRRSQPQFYDAQDYQKQKKKTPKKRQLSYENEYKSKYKNESATARARRRRALRRAKREPPPSGDRTRDTTPQLKPSQLARCRLILQEINRRMCSVTWQPPPDSES